MMILRKFRMYRRSNGIYYFYLRDPQSGRFLSARSSRTRNKLEAEKAAARAYKQHCDGHEQGSYTADTSVVLFLKSFYGSGQGSWVSEKRARNSNALMSDHIRATRSAIERYLVKLIGYDITLAEVTPLWLRKIQRELHETNGTLAPQTLNAIFSSLTRAIRFAAAQWIIPKDPTEGIIAYVPRRKMTGCFEQTEVTSLLAFDWDDPIGKLMFLVAIHTGMRLGEIQALMKGNLQMRVNEDGELYLVEISHSWSKTHGVKSPKNGKTRTIPIPSWLWYELQEFVGADAAVDTFVFASSRSGKPVSDKLPRAALVDALIAIGISEEQQRARNLRFHSTRHYFNSVMAPLVQNEALRKVIGHSSPEMTDHYHHVTETELRMVKTAQEEAFPVIPFTVKGATA